MFFYQLPQHLIAILYLKFFRLKLIKKSENNLIYKNKYNFNMTLGNYIFMSSDTLDKIEIAHEFGHSKLSYILGWFYLILIGIPILIRLLLLKLKIIKESNYYKSYPENLADFLGGIIIANEKRRFIK